VKAERKLAMAVGAVGWGWLLWRDWRLSVILSLIFFANNLEWAASKH
jgi:hypothetical protein